MIMILSRKMETIEMDGKEHEIDVGGIASEIMNLTPKFFSDVGEVDRFLSLIIGANNP